MNLRDELNLYRKQTVQLRILITVAAVALAAVSLGASEAPDVLLSEIFDDSPSVMHSEVYTVSRGDTLWYISAKYIDRNTHGTGDIRDYYCEIIKNNWQVFQGRRHGEVHPGDKLTITWWEKE